MNKIECGDCPLVDIDVYGSCYQYCEKMKARKESDYQQGKADYESECQKIFEDNPPMHFNHEQIMWLKEFVNVRCKQARNDAIDDYTDWLRKTHANFDENYAEDIKSDYLELLKEQK